MVHDFAVRLQKRLSIEGRLPIEHLVHTHSQRPPVTLGPVLPFPILHGQQDLGRDVIWGSYCNRGLYLSETELRVRGIITEPWTSEISNRA